MRGIGLFLCLAAQGASEEKGKFILSFSGREAGSEEYRLEQFDDGQIVLHSKARFDLPVQGKPQPVVTDAVLTMDRDLRPLRYAGLEKTGARERRSKIEWKDGAAWPEPRRSVKTSAAALLDAHLCSQWIPILRRADGPKKKIKVFSAVAMGDVDWTVEDKGEVTLRGREASARAREYQLTSGTDGLTAHVDGRKRLVRISNPATGALAELEGFEGFVPEGRTELEVTFPSGARPRTGLLTLPAGAKQSPAVVLLCGPPDGGEQGLDVKSIAAALLTAGIAALRVEDQGGVGLSDAAADLESAVAFLRSREDVGAVGLIGHGEAAAVASIVAGRDPKVRAVVLLAAAAKPLDAVLLERIGLQLRDSGVQDAAAAPILESQKATFRRIRDSREDWMEIDERRTYIGRLRDLFGHDPSAQLGKVKAEILILQGTADRNVLPEHAELLARARPGAELRLFEGLDHRFQKAADPDRRIDAEFLKVLADRTGALLR